MTVDMERVGEAVEEVFRTYQERRFSTIVGPKGLTDEELREVRGQAQACRELRVQIRNVLGYTPVE